MDWKKIGLFAFLVIVGFILGITAGRGSYSGRISDLNAELRTARDFNTEARNTIEQQDNEIRSLGDSNTELERLRQEGLIDYNSLREEIERREDYYRESIEINKSLEGSEREHQETIDSLRERNNSSRTILERARARVSTEVN